MEELLVIDGPEEGHTVMVVAKPPNAVRLPSGTYWLRQLTYGTTQIRVSAFVYSCRSWDELNALPSEDTAKLLRTVLKREMRVFPALQELLGARD